MNQSASGGVEEPIFTVSALVLTLAGTLGVALCVPSLLKVTGRRRVGGGQPASLETTRETEGQAGSRLVDPPRFFAPWRFVRVLAYNVTNLLF